MKVHVMRNIKVSTHTFFFAKFLSFLFPFPCFNHWMTITLGHRLEGLLRATNRMLLLIILKSSIHSMPDSIVNPILLPQTDQAVVVKIRHEERGKDTKTYFID